MSDYAYGFCPKCGVPGMTRERRPNGNDMCFNGDVYPSRDAISEMKTSQQFGLSKHAKPTDMNVYWRDIQAWWQ